MGAAGGRVGGPATGGAGLKAPAVARGLQNRRRRLGIVDRLAGREAPQAGCRDPSRLRILPATQYRTVSTIPAWARTSERRSPYHPQACPRGHATPGCLILPEPAL